VWHSLQGVGLPDFLATPIISGTGKTSKLRTSNLAGRPIHSQGPSEQKPIKNFREKGAWAYPGTAQIFRYPPLSQEWIKVRTSHFVRAFIGSIRSKAHEKFCEK